MSSTGITNSGIGKLLTTGLIDNGINDGLLTPKQEVPELIKPIEPIKPMPTINDDAVKKARNSKLLNLQKQSGAASTILTGDKFGG